MNNHSINVTITFNTIMMVFLFTPFSWKISRERVKHINLFLIFGHFPSEDMHYSRGWFNFWNYYYLFHILIVSNVYAISGVMDNSIYFYKLTITIYCKNIFFYRGGVGGVCLSALTYYFKAIL